MTNEQLNTLCSGAVLYAGATGRPLIAGGVHDGLPWVLFPTESGPFRFLPVQNLREEPGPGGEGFLWRDAEGSPVLSIVPLEQCEEFSAGETQQAIDEARAYYLEGEGKGWLDAQIGLGGETPEWTGPGSI